MRIFPIAVLASLFLLSPLRGSFIQPDLQKVPVKTLLANLEKQAAADPKKAAAQHHLARAHAMAYAQNLAETDSVNLQGEKKELWFGYSAPFVPYHKKTEPKDAAAKTRAASHLKKAIAHYSKALELKPEDATIRLGYGWCLEQSGKKAEAIEAYRVALKEFWKKESKMGGTFGPIATVEGAGYLVPLLDKEKDAKEIAELNERVAKMKALPRAVTPIAIALKPDTALSDVVAPDASVVFDADGSGRQVAWNWITPKAAWLVYDLQGTGQIDSAIQLFGSRTFMLFLEDGYAALRLLDADANDALSGNELQNLALWQDRNSNGISDAGEVRPLADWGIESLHTKGTVHSSGIPYAPFGVRFTDGHTTPSFDVLLREVPAAR